MTTELPEKLGEKKKKKKKKASVLYYSRVFRNKRAD